MIAVLVNTATVLLGSVLGLLFRNKINENLTKAVISALAPVRGNVRENRFTEGFVTACIVFGVDKAKRL